MENLRSRVRQAWISAPARGAPATASSPGSGEKTPPLQACWRHEGPRRRHPGECHDTAGAQPTSATLTRPGERAGSYCSLPAASWVSSPHPSYAKGRPSSGFQRAWGLPPTPPPGTSQHPPDHVLKGRGQAPSCGSYAEPLCAPTGFLHPSQRAQAFLFLKDASGASLGAQW